MTDKIDTATRDLARGLVRGSIIEDAAAQFIAQVLKHAHGTMRSERDAALARAEAAEAALDGAASHLENLLEVMATPDRQLCCDGRECGCQGATVYMEAEHYAREELNKIRALTTPASLKGGDA